MAFEKPVPEWLEKGSEPPESLKRNGWSPEDKPAAQHFNYMMNKLSEATKELQEGAAESKDLIQAEERLSQQLSNIDDAVGVNLSDYPRLAVETDDTMRFRRAIGALGLSLSSSAAGYEIGTFRQFYIPNGRYKISDTLLIPGTCNIISDGGAIIEQTDNSKNILQGRSTTVDIYGIKFVGGKNAIYLSNANADATIFNIERCEFHAQQDYAIRTWGEGYPANPTDNHLSANITIYKCKFIKTNGAVYDVSDSCVVSDTWVYQDRSNFSADKAVFVNRYGLLYLDNMFGVPTMGTGGERVLNARWVDNYGSVYIDKSRFGWEDEGISGVYHFGATFENSTHIGTTVSIKNTQTSAGFQPNNPTDALIILKTGVPMNTVIEDNRYQVLIPYIRVDAAFDLQAYINAIPHVQERISISIKKNATWAAGDYHTDIQKLFEPYPKELQRFVDKGDVDKRLFPMYPTKRVDVSATSKRYVFQVPDGCHVFSGLLTVSGNHNRAGEARYRNSATFLIEYQTGYNTKIINILSHKAISDATDKFPTTPKPTITSLHFGDTNEGSDRRDANVGGLFSIVVHYGSAASYDEVTFVPLHIGQRTSF